MPAETTPQPKRETWRDWLPEGVPEPDLAELLSRDELIQALQDRGIDVSARTLAYWESEGVTPRPVRRWRGGAPAALYPSWFVDAVAFVRQSQASGIPLRIIGPLLRSWSLLRYSHEIAEHEEQLRARRKYQPSPEDIEPPVAALAHQHRRVHGGPPIVKAEIRFTDATGVEFVVHSFAPPPAPEDLVAPPRTWTKSPEDVA